MKIFWDVTWTIVSLYRVLEACDLAQREQTCDQLEDDQLALGAVTSTTQKSSSHTDPDQTHRQRLD